MWKRLIALVLAVSLIGASTAQEQQEQQIGREVYSQLERQGKILRESPYYAVLNPLGARIAASANKQYFAPFHFILVHDKQPNAFAVPGGNVYVTDSMMTFVQNKEELTGVLCHEVSHTIHHDVWDLYVKSQRVSIWSTLAQVLLGQKSQIVSFGINLLANVQVLRFSRDVEHNADMSGAHICAQSGVSPWGMVWLMKRFLDKNRGSGPEFLSDHPTDSHRVADLERLFADNPRTYGSFNASIANATPMHESGLRSQYAARAAPKPQATPTCPPGWKFCSRVPR